MSTTSGTPRQLASGTLTVAAGLVVTGTGTVLMMAMAARSLPAREYAAFAVWWTVATLLGTGFGVFEAYLARLVVTDLTGQRSPRRVTGVMLGRALVAVVGVVTVVLLLAPWLSASLLEGEQGAALLVPVFVLLTALQAVQRGSATGHRRFKAVAGQLSTDGVARVVLTAAVIGAGHASVSTLAVAACVAAALGLVTGGLLCPAWWARPRLRDRQIPLKPVLLLLIGAVGPLLVNNGSVPWFAWTHSVDPYTLGAFAGAVTLSRIPTQLVSAAFGPLLAQLSHSVETGDGVSFRRLQRSADHAAWVLAVLFVLGFAVLGPLMLRIYLGPGYSLPLLTLVVLAATSGLMFVTVVQQAGLAALDRWEKIAVAWVIGTIGFGIVLLLPGGNLQRATAAPLVAVGVALVVMSGSRAGRMVVTPSPQAAHPQLPGADSPDAAP
jgi:O-antigen/teichoic acid export membrane protein